MLSPITIFKKMTNLIAKVIEFKVNISTIYNLNTFPTKIKLTLWSMHYLIYIVVIPITKTVLKMSQDHS